MSGLELGLDKVPFLCYSFSMDILKKIISRIEITPSNCWIWQGSKNNKGYGKVVTNYDSHTRKSTTKLVHRAMYEISNGKIPIGLFVCHTCDIPLCCNPTHLFIGTQKDNMHDMIKKGKVNLQFRNEAIKKSWTSKRRLQKSKQSKSIMMKIHNEKAKQAGVPINWKYCPSCKHWYPRSNFHKNRARYDGIQPLCKSCAIRQRILQKKKKSF